MTRPMNPNDFDNPGPGEYSYGAGLFAPGIANNEAQKKYQDDFGEPYSKLGLAADGTTLEDNYARAVADRRTDPTDPSSNRDFNCYGNPDRFGPNPALVQTDPQPNTTEYHSCEWPPLERKA